MTGHPALGTILPIDEHTALVLGQELDRARKQPDVGNVLLHRADDTLFMIDTGVTTPFRQALLDAVDTVGPWRRLIVLTTHGHVDHAGNNDLADELSTERGITAEHYFPAADLDQLIDPAGYWARSFAAVRRAVELPGPAPLVAAELTSWFTPFRPFASVSRTYEQRPLERLVLGGRHTLGWSFADGAVLITRSQGHNAGHVLIHLTSNRVLHVGDELNGPGAMMVDADPVKLATVFETTRGLLDQGAVEVVTDGHSPAPLDRDQALTRVSRFQEQECGLHRATLDLTDGSDELVLADVLPAYADALLRLGISGPNANTVFTAMKANRGLGVLGLRPDLTARHWRRPALTAREHRITDALRRLIAAGRP